MKKSTRSWVRKAEADFQLAIEVHRGKKRYHDQVCFLGQQATEKYLKAVMEELGLKIPRTHHLDDLLDLIVPDFSEIQKLRRGLIYLSAFAEGTRYPGQDASRRQAIAAMRWADRVRGCCREFLGL